MRLSPDGSPGPATGPRADDSRTGSAGWRDRADESVARYRVADASDSGTRICFVIRLVIGWRMMTSTLVLLSQKAAGFGPENHNIGGDSHSSRGLRWVAGERMTVDRGLQPMSGGL